jgi:hypothetical protein
MLNSMLWIGYPDKFLWHFEIDGFFIIIIIIIIISEHTGMRLSDPLHS